VKILILTVGSRGDVQPFIALAKGLMGAGHKVTLCTGRTYADWVQGHGINYLPMNDDLLRLKDTAQGAAAVEGKGASLALIKQVMPLLRVMLDDSWKAASAAHPDLLIYHPKSLSGLHLAEKLQIPAIMSMMLPMYTPTGAFPNPGLMPTAKLPAALNRMTYGLNRLLIAPYSGMINKWRKEALGLPARPRLARETGDAHGNPIPILYGYSRHLVPAHTDWDNNSYEAGFWFLEQEQAWTPPVDLVQFLDAGAPPVYIGFGSMVSRDPERKARIALDALNISGQRGVLASGWGALKLNPADVPNNVFLLNEAPHDWLFPRMAAVVHHGGSGTTAAGLKAGRPTVIVPFLGDQPFWGRCVERIGAGPKPIPQKQYNAEMLAAAISQAVTDKTMVRRAAEIGKKLCTEDGVANAIQFIERVTSS
jgi:sterol 3beta-glucosyltransferase